jgi:hypothetical protein
MRSAPLRSALAMNARERNAALRFAAFRFARIRSASFRFTSLRFASRRFALVEVRTDIGVLVTPFVPGRHALLEQCDVLVVRHGSAPEVLRRTMRGRW